jgi:hypothetical protein
VPLGASRLRLQLMANHNSQQLRRAVQVIGECVERAAAALAGARARQPLRKAG